MRHCFSFTGKLVNCILQLTTVLNDENEIQYFSMYNGSDGIGVTAHFVIPSTNLSVHAIEDIMKSESVDLPDGLK